MRETKREMMPAIENNKIYSYRNDCRLCGEIALKNIIQFAELPIADALLDEQQLFLPEIKIPLTFCVCTKCFHAQVREDILPAILFGQNYPYYTGVSAALSQHFISSAENLIKRFDLNTTSRVIEIASNDGTMLNVFNTHGCNTLGVDPATGPCSTAAAKGLKVLNTFFTAQLAAGIKSDFGKANLILGNNVLAHVPNPNDLVSGIAGLLSEEGNVVIEVPYLLTLLTDVQFDTIFHQHYSYFSLHAVEMLFNQQGLFLNDVEQVAIHGGSIRLFFSWKEGETQQLADLKKAEQHVAINSIVVYEQFAERTKK